VQTLIAGACTLLTALACNDAFKSLFEEGGQLHYVKDWGPWVYAIVITILAVLTTNAIADLGDHLQALQDKEDIVEKVDINKTRNSTDSTQRIKMWTQVR
jgi:hypothetical protein